MLRELSRGLNLFLAASEVDALVCEFAAGISVKARAERYGIHRATVLSHLRRRNVRSRRPGLRIHEKAEAVCLARTGASIRAIGRRMGVGRKVVRAALAEADLTVDDAAPSPGMRLCLSKPNTMQFSLCVTELHGRMLEWWYESKRRQTFSRHCAGVRWC